MSRMFIRSRPLRILQAVGGLNRGGVETWALNTVKHIDRDRYRIDFLVDSTQNYPYNEELRSLGCSVLPCQNYRNVPAYWVNLKAIYKEHGPYDIVHSHVHYFTGVILSMTAALGIPHRIAHVHPAVDLKPDSFGRRIYRAAMMRAISRNATAVLACSDTSLHAFVNRCRPKTRLRQVLHNGVDLSAYTRNADRASIRSSLGLPHDKLLVTYVARFVPHKNHAQLLRIAERFAKTHPAVHFVMIGSHGSLLDEVTAACRRMSNVSLLTDLPDVSDALLSSDIFLFPSLEEGFGVVALEAAAAGLPVVATDLPTIREALAPSHRELMFPPNNDDRAVESLLRVVLNPDVRLATAREGLAWVQRFSMTESVATLTAFYDRLAEPQRDAHICATAQNQTREAGLCR